jgi:hypothetical protein
MLAIPKQIHEYVDLVHGLRELVHEGQVATPLSDDAVGKIMQLVALVQSSCTEAAEVKALSETFNQQAVFMSSCK